jgi:UDP-N-acetyl-D-mannosaminuronate dehydrogenase
MKSLVIGAGQIGKALQEIFLKAHICFLRDVDDLHCEDVEVLHIAYPYSVDFVDITRAYINQYKPKLTIIHSSVAVGATDKCGAHVVHSPERGRYPHLAAQMQKFQKFIGGGDAVDRLRAKSYFDALGWETVLVDDSRQTELCKLLSNIHLGLEIAWRQEVDRISESLLGMPAGAVYSAWEKSYNDGHTVLGHRQLLRPIVRPAPIGGHCILPCTDILSKQFDSDLFRFIKGSNAKRKTEEESTADCAVSHR